MAQNDPRSPLLTAPSQQEATSNSPEYAATSNSAVNEEPSHSSPVPRDTKRISSSHIEDSSTIMVSPPVGTQSDQHVDRAHARRMVSPPVGTQSDSPPMLVPILIALTSVLVFVLNGEFFQDLQGSVSPLFNLFCAHVLGLMLFPWVSTGFFKRSLTRDEWSCSGTSKILTNNRSGYGQLDDSTVGGRMAEDSSLESPQNHGAAGHETTRDDPPSLNNAPSSTTLPLWCTGYWPRILLLTVFLNAYAYLWVTSTYSVAVATTQAVFQLNLILLMVCEGWLHGFSEVCVWNKIVGALLILVGAFALAAQKGRLILVGRSLQLGRCVEENHPLR